ncbi:MAG: signal peptide peptidase SppA [Acidobacteria bacterium]|nr:signal peptide peptidase SppA [Acidobacteriota bacterium]
MKKTLIVILVIVLVLIGLGLIMLGLVSSLLDREPMVRSRSVLQLNLEGELPESAAVDFMSSVLEEPALAFKDIQSCIHKAAADDRIRGIWLKVNMPALGWGKVEELQTALTEFKASGKFVVATSVVTREIDYACALPADEIYLPPESMFEFNGFVAQAMFVRDMLDNLYIEPQVVRIGDFKSAGDMLARNTMSDAQREVMNTMLNQTLERFIGMVHQHRDMEKERVDQLLQQGLHSPHQAMENGLVDGILYPDEVEKVLKEKCGLKETDRLPVVTAQKYRQVSWDHLVDYDDQEKIAVIYAVGGIVRGEDTFNPLLGRSMGSDSVIDMIQKVRKDDAVKAVVLRVDSPGGDGLASDLMWRELQLLDQEKPVIASMSDVAASGGYYIAMGCRKIVAQPGTVTGSIGVVSAVMNMRKMYDYIGVDYETVEILNEDSTRRYQYADMMTDTRPMREDEWQRFQKETREFYDAFVKKAAESRGVAADEMHQWAQGRVWTGTQALEHNLVDELGGLDKAIEVAKQEAGIPVGKRLRVVTYPIPRSFFDQLMSGMSQTALGPVSTQVRQRLQYLNAFAGASSRAPLAVMPYHLEIR